MSLTSCMDGVSSDAIDGDAAAVDMRQPSSPFGALAWDETEIEAAHSPLSETLVAMPAWTSHSLLYISILLVVAGVLLAIFGRVDEVSTAPAVVAVLGRLKPVQSELEGIVTELLVKEGDSVTAGQPLAAIDSPEVVTLLTEVRAAERALADLQSELQTVLPLKENQLRSQMEILRKKSVGHRRRHEALTDQLAKEDQALELARQKHELELAKHAETLERLELEHANALHARAAAAEELAAMEELQSKGAASKLELLDSQRKHGDAVTAAAKLRSKLAEAADQKRIQDVTLRVRINDHEKTLATIREQIAENAVTFQSTELEIRQKEDELELQRLQLVQRRDTAAFRAEQARRKAKLNLGSLASPLLDRIGCGEAQATDRHLVLAPIDGVVGSIAVTAGETAQRGTTLMTLVPEDAELVMELRIANREMGRIQEQLPARFKFDAFPYAEHGALTGRLTRLVKVAESVPRSAPAGTTAPAVSASGGSYYRGYCTLQQRYFRVKGQRKPLMPGMTATTEIVTGRKRIIEILLKPLLEFQQGRKAER